MSKIKSLILGSAAGLVAIAGAQAADLPVKAKAVQYVKICSLYGAGFYYIPGTDTCLKIGGFAQFDVGINGSFYAQPYYSGGENAFQTAGRNYFSDRIRFQLALDTRTATEYGVVRAYSDTKFQWTNTVDGVAGGSFETDNVFVQFAGFTMGKAASPYSTPWHSVGANNNNSALLGGHDNLTGTPQISYTWQFGNGLSAQLGVEDPSGIAGSTATNGNSVPGTFGYDRAFLLNVNNLFGAGTGLAGAAGAGGALATGAFTNSYGGTTVPDITGNIRLDNAAFTAQLSGAVHALNSSYYTASPGAGVAATTVATNGGPSDKYGYAVQGGFQLKNLPTGPGDKFTVDVGYAKGANRYIIGGTTGNFFAIGGQPINAASYQSIGLGISADAVYGLGTGLELTSAYGVRGGFVHNWSPTWESDVFGSYSRIDYNGTASALFCAGLAAAATGIPAGNCNPDFSIYQVGTRLGWTPVRNLTFSGEVLYSFLDQSFTGSVVGLKPTPLSPTATYDFKDMGTVSGNLRVRRSF